MGNFRKSFSKWKKSTGEHGPRAMTRFVIILFVEGLQSVAPNRYIFKGGNLLWHYIKTPRSTVDIDFATDTKVELKQVLNDLSRVQNHGCTFSVKAYSVVDSTEKSGASIQMEFTTDEGSTNPFKIDIIFAVKTHSKIIKLMNKKLKAATIENIIVDKVAACHRFAGGNTRMKDFDDLYRIAVSKIEIDPLLLNQLAVERSLQLSLNPQWINKQMKSDWQEYTRKKIYKSSTELPGNIEQVIDIINYFLQIVTIIAK